jgi:hypothetical protein
MSSLVAIQVVTIKQRIATLPNDHNRQIPGWWSTKYLALLSMSSIAKIKINLVRWTSSQSKHKSSSSTYFKATSNLEAIKIIKSPASTCQATILTCNSSPYNSLMGGSPSFESMAFKASNGFKCPCQPLSSHQPLVGGVGLSIMYKNHRTTIKINSARASLLALLIPTVSYTNTK